MRASKQPAPLPVPQAESALQAGAVRLLTHPQLKHQGFVLQRSLVRHAACACLGSLARLSTEAAQATGLLVASVFGLLPLVDPRNSLVDGHLQ